MKKLILAVAVLLFTGVAFSQKKIDIEQEKAAIIAVIEEETNAFLKQDIERVEATWNQDSKSRKIFFNFLNEGEYLEVKGKEELREYEEWNLHGEWREEAGNMDVQFTNYEINIYDNTALVFFDFNDQKRILHLVKTEGNWRQDLMVILVVEKELSLNEAIAKEEKKQ